MKELRIKDGLFSDREARAQTGARVVIGEPGIQDSVSRQRGGADSVL